MNTKKKKDLLVSALSYMSKITEDLHKYYHRYLLIVLIGQVLSTVIVLMIGKSIDAYVGTNTKYSLSLLLWAIFVSSIIRCILAVYEATYHITRIAYDIGGTVERYTLSRLSKFSPNQTIRINSGLKMDTLQKGSVAVSELMGLLVSNLIPTIFKVVIAVGILVYIHWSIGLALMLSVIAFILVSVEVNNRYSERIAMARKLESDLDTKFWEIIKHLKLVIMSASQKETYDRFSESQEKMYKEGRKVWTSYNRMAGFSRNLPFDHMIQAPLLMLVFYLVGKGHVSIGDIAVIISTVSIVYVGINGVGTIQRQLIRHSINVTRLKDMVEQVPECSDVEDPISINPRGEIEFRNVTFAYTPGNVAIHNVSFRIKTGETVAFVGRSGSGKSTLVSLLLRGIVPERGEILIDGTPLNLVEINSFRRNVGVVSQDIMLWDDSLRTNVTFGTRDLGQARFEEIIKLACIDEFADRLGATGFDTMIGENGIQLSGGQRQRIAIARVFARNPKIIVFDEATSALDYEIEARVYEAMDRALQDRTGIIIAHRLGTVRKADRIIVLDKGEIVGEGTFTELSANNKHFQQLISSEIR